MRMPSGVLVSVEILAFPIMIRWVYVQTLTDEKYQFVQVSRPSHRGRYLVFHSLVYLLIWRVNR